MKIKKKLMMYLLAIVSIFILKVNDVYAAQKVKISFDYQSNVYYTRKGDGLNDSHQYLYYNLNGIPAFCIEPGVEINDWDYLVYGIEKSPFNAEKTHRMQLIGYYGYEYPGHKTQKYRMATQALIWETAKNLKVEFYTKINGGGTHIDISNERNEILRLVETHYDKPSFDTQNFDATYNKEIVIDDTNNVLSNFDIYDSGNNEVRIENNKLYITPKQMSSSEIKFIKKNYDEETTIIFVGENGKSQKLGRFRIADPVTSTIKLNTTGGTISIEKKDSETNLNTPQGNAKLSNAKYGIYDESDNLITEITTNNEGKGTSSLINRIGTFYLKEISSPEGYLLDNTKYSVEITDSNLNPTVVVKDTVIKGKVKVNKLDSELNSCRSQGNANLVGAKYGIYNKSNELVETLTIGNDCTSISKDLPYGNYNVKEITAGNGYYLDKTSYTVNITSNGETSEITSKDEVIKAKIKITKIDSETNTCKAQGDSSLVGAKYNIYDEVNNIVETLTIGNDCTAISKDLPYGKYRIQEISSSIGYKIDENMYDADIINSNTINITSKEEVIKGTIKIIKVDKDNNSCNAQGEASLSGAKFEIRDKNNNVIETLTIGDDCTAISKDLPYGEYKIIEKENPKGYYLNENTFNVSIKDQVIPIQLRATISNNYEVVVQDEVIKNDFIFNKFYGNQSTGFIYSEPNAVFEITNNKNEVVETFTTDKNGYAKVNLPYGNYKVKQIKGLEEYKMMGTFDISVNEDSDLTQVKNIKNGEITAKLKLIKIDADTKETINLSGFKFKIKNTKTNEYICQTTDKVICEYETNNEGILITPLPLFAGDYEIEEIKTVPNYLLSNGKVNFSIRDNNKIIHDETFGSIVEVYFENKEVKGKINITKYGEKTVINEGKLSFEKELLNNVSFKLLSDDKVIKEFTIKDGKYTIDNLSLGKYCLVETKTNDKYVLDDKPHCFELKYKDDKTPIIEYNIELDNYLKKSDLEFSKTDFVNGNPIPNTKIEIYTDKDELIFTGITDNEGKIKLEKLPIGKYYILEKEPATSYLISDEKVIFEVKEDGKVIKANMTNKKITGDLEISKTDLSTDEPIPDVLFEIYDNKNNLIFSKRTDENGKITIRNLEYGDYYFLEKEAKEGYVLNDEKMYFSIKEDGKVIKSNVKNRKIIGSIEITKMDISTSETLPNTLLSIYNMNDELIFSDRTDENGKIVINNLEYGKYYIIESEAPEGYLINDEKMFFEIKEDGEIVKATITDEKIIIEVPKTDQNKNYKLIVYASIILLLGIGIILYEKKKNKKK